MPDYSTWPGVQGISDDWPLHAPSNLWPWHDLQAYACQKRLPLNEVVFDPRCDECISAAIGYVDAGQGVSPGFGAIYDRYIQVGDAAIQCSLQEFVEWAQYNKKKAAM